ncbi:MAG TPA: PIG-L family deacetylase [Steroidobacteraceae bacterium]|nr:PIG-L family deacetylase [Steroidobacteraceae bacterium]
MTADRGETTLFLLGHPDDEIAFAPLVSRIKSKGQIVRIVYLTDGGVGRATPDIRSTESVRALASLGVASAEIHFLGKDLSVPDGLLFRRLTPVYDALEAECSSIGSLGEIYTLGWEGGNLDHDAAHVIGLALAVARDRVHRAWQVAFYRAAGLGPPFFSLFAPLRANGPVSRLSLTRPESRLRLRLIRYFPSQWRSFVGLGPVLLWHALASPVLKVQPMKPRRLWERPAPGRLLYEQRSGVSFAEFAGCVTAFLGERGITPERP